MATETTETTETTEKGRALEMLTKLLPKDGTVYTVLRTVAKSGMSRVLDVYTIIDNKPVYLTGYVSKVLNYTRTDRGLRVHGCGMDAGFQVAYDLNSLLHDDGYALRHEWI